MIESSSISHNRVRIALVFSITVEELTEDETLVDEVESGVYVPKIAQPKIVLQVLGHLFFSCLDPAEHDICPSITS